MRVQVVSTALFESHIYVHNLLAIKLQIRSTTQHAHLTREPCFFYRTSDISLGIFKHEEQESHLPYCVLLSSPLDPFHNRLNDGR